MLLESRVEKLKKFEHFTNITFLSPTSLNYHNHHKITNRILAKLELES